MDESLESWTPAARGIDDVADVLTKDLARGRSAPLLSILSFGSCVPSVPEEAACHTILELVVGIARGLASFALNIVAYVPTLLRVGNWTRNEGGGSSRI